MTEPRKKLIEVALPLEAINAASAKEKSIRHGHPSTLHLWWARRPLAACRSVLFGQLVDDPSAWPDRFPTDEAQEKERLRLFGIIERMVIWKNSNNEAVIYEARREIARSLAWGRGEEPPKDRAAIDAYIAEHAPPVYDPFSGGGSIPLEALRLGLKAYGSDLNPVAVMIGKALVEIPPKFAGLPPVNPDSRAELAKGGRWNAKGAQGLAEDVRHYGQWMRDEAYKRIGHLYPQVDLPADHNGGKATVIAWIWARTVKCPNPACGAQMPLLGTYFLSAKPRKQAWLEPIIDRGGGSPRISFEIHTGSCPAERSTELKLGTGYAGAKGKKAKAVFRCIACDQGPVKGAYIDEEANAGRMGNMLVAVVAAGERSRNYFPASADQLNAAEQAVHYLAECVPPNSVPTEPCRGTFASNAQGRRYGFRTFGDYFTPRQLVALTTFSDLVGEARERALADARADGMADDPTPLTEGGAGAAAYADAVAVYLGLAVSKLTDAQSSLVRWKPSMDQAIGTFGRQAIPMVWDYAESNIFSGMAGDYAVTLHNLLRVVDNLIVQRHGTIEQKNAGDSEKFPKGILISTDPPYYDNIGYADLSDFFYVWMRRSLRSQFPTLFGTMLVPKAEELVATPYRHGGKDQAETFFMEGIGKVLHNIAEHALSGYPVAFYYAFKQSEREQDGIASTGWATFLDAVIRSGLSIDGTWPMRTELGNRMIGSGTNALASSIVLVCRKRPADAPVTTRAEFVKALKRELPEAIRLLQHGNLAPVDMAQAAIGPGMAVFSRFAQVLESDDSPMTVKTALQLINAALDEHLSEQDSDYDSDTRFAITWFDSNGMETGPYGTAEQLATARGISVAGVVQAGIMEARGGKARLLRRDEMPANWDPTADDRLTVWECTQHLIRVLEGEAEAAAAALLARLGPRADAARELAYRLYQICERRKWADEARAYNGLVVVWPDLGRMAAETATEAVAGPAEPKLL